jgi:FeS assembly SUF system protein
MNDESQTSIAQAEVTPVSAEQLRQNVIVALRTIFDPEIPVNIYDLGLIYGLDIHQDGKIDIRMTLTAPACPVADTFPGVVESRLSDVPGVTDVRVDLVWDPPWSMESLSDEVRLQLGLL